MIEYPFTTVGSIRTKAWHAWTRKERGRALQSLPLFGGLGSLTCESWIEERSVSSRPAADTPEMRTAECDGELDERSVVQDAVDIQPCSACATMAVRVEHFVFSMMCLMWALTVGSVMPSAEAISLLVNPLARFCTTVCSRLVS